MISATTFVNQWWDAMSKISEVRDVRFRPAGQFAGSPLAAATELQHEDETLPCARHAPGIAAGA